MSNVFVFTNINLALIYRNNILAVFIIKNYNPQKSIVLEKFSIN